MHCALRRTRRAFSDCVFTKKFFCVFAARLGCCQKNTDTLKSEAAFPLYVFAGKGCLFSGLSAACGRKAVTGGKQRPPTGRRAQAALSAPVRFGRRWRCDSDRAVFACLAAQQHSDMPRYCRKYPAFSGGAVCLNKNSQVHRRCCGWDVRGYFSQHQQNFIFSTCYKCIPVGVFLDGKSGLNIFFHPAACCKGRIAHCRSCSNMDNPLFFH